jgi:hypothetical protein
MAWTAYKTKEIIWREYRKVNKWTDRKVFFKKGKVG